MPNTVQSTNMLLPIPVVGQDPGPDWAENINSCLTIIDMHDHSSGSGVQITPNGLNINSDLAFNNNNLTASRSIRFQPQSAVLAGASDVGCLYEVTDDLYYNDGLGNQIRITQSGAVAGTPGSIANLVSPASASYVSASSTFVWQSDASTAANLDAGAVIFRNLTASSQGITVQAPSALASSYSLTLPPLPNAQKIMTLDSSGNITAPYSLDNVTLEVSANVLRIKDSGVSTAKIANAAVTKPKLAGSTVLTSSSCGSFNTTSSSYVDVTNLEQAITLSYQRPVIISLIPAGQAQPAQIASGGTATIGIFRAPSGGSYVAIAEFIYANSTGGALPFYLDQPLSADTYSYKVMAKFTGSFSLDVINVKLSVLEL